MKKQVDAVKIEGLTIGDEYLFETVLLENKELTKQLIEKLIDISGIEDIEYISTEETHRHSYDSRGVRFDVYIKSQTGVAYIVELQRTDTKELQKRARYYQIMSDSKQLPKGKAHHYKDLKDNYVIFICLEDIFGYGYYKYSFENICSEVEGLKLQDGTHKIFFNTQGSKGNISGDVKAFLRLIEGEISDNSLVKKLEAAADEIKADEVWRETYMQSLLRDQDTLERGIEQGIQQGRFEEKIEMAEKLFAKGMSIEDVSEITELAVERLTSLRLVNEPSD